MWEGIFVAYFAALLAQSDGEWTASDLDLDDVEDFAEILDRVGDSSDDEAQTVVFLVEEDDEYVAVVRADPDTDPRVFVSDARAESTSRLGALLHAEAEASEVHAPVDERAADAAETFQDDRDPAAEETDADADGAATAVHGGGTSDDDDERADADTEPVGDPGVLSDLGISGTTLLSWAVSPGTLPSDITGSIAEMTGRADEVDALRGA